MSEYKTSSTRRGQSHRKNSSIANEKQTKRSHRKKKKSKKKLEKSDSGKYSTSPECEENRPTTAGWNGTSNQTPASPTSPQDISSSSNHDMDRISDLKLEGTSEPTKNDAIKPASDSPARFKAEPSGSPTDNGGGCAPTAGAPDTNLATFSSVRADYMGRISTGCKPQEGRSGDRQTVSHVVYKDTLRWEHQLDDSDAEEERLRVYKLNRRKRYLAASNKSYAEWMPSCQQTSGKQKSKSTSIMTNVSNSDVVKTSEISTRARGTQGGALVSQACPQVPLKC